ncbi:hypothetical protein GPECTOR_10g1009 [Gonium pectorale]|uniref:Bidirectional sugar transporter SWEET n=1 Tax=Gonium pectorale TaxID=33097 RepID=A0A150GQ76_GONPE|nr:hypothetical protein GPECTOR_10g1009 [Gonium pectorale]|eukprot:KXZ51987.1 hypothetical protein GPECTOR_10g1009 [Gonium pectorale]
MRGPSAEASEAAVHDSFIAVPNAIGATFGLIQLALIQIYPAKKDVSRGAAPQQAAAAAPEQEPLLAEGRGDGAA